MRFIAIITAGALVLAGCATASHQAAEAPPRPKCDPPRPDFAKDPAHRCVRGPAA